MSNTRSMKRVYADDTEFPSRIKKIKYQGTPRSGKSVTFSMQYQNKTSAASFNAGQEGKITRFKFEFPGTLGMIKTLAAKQRIGTANLGAEALYRGFSPKEKIMFPKINKVTFHDVTIAPGLMMKQHHDAAGPVKEHTDLNTYLPPVYIYVTREEEVICNADDPSTVVIDRNIELNEQNKWLALINARSAALWRRESNVTGYYDSYNDKDIIDQVPIGIEHSDTFIDMIPHTGYQLYEDSVFLYIDAYVSIQSMTIQMDYSEVAITVEDLMARNNPAYKLYYGPQISKYYGKVLTSDNTWDKITGILTNGNLDEMVVMHAVESTTDGVTTRTIKKKNA